MKRLNKLLLLVSFCLLLGSSNQALALEDEFICAAAQAIGCALDAPCIKGSADSVNLPLLWRVNLKDGHITSLRHRGEERSSQIIEMIEEENTLSLFGVDPGSAWSVYIDREDGKMTMTSSTYDAGYIIHGDCSSAFIEQ